MTKGVNNMRLYLISQDQINTYGTYEAAVVSAIDEKDAVTIHPSAYVTHVTKGQWMGTYTGGPEKGKEYPYVMPIWPPYEYIDCIKAEYIGETNQPRGVILASFNEG